MSKQVRKTKRTKNRKFFRMPNLGTQIISGLILGIIFGAFVYDNHNVIVVMQNLGTMFINLIQMIVLPIIFSCLVVGIANIGSFKALGRIGLKTIIYFEVITTIAIVVGLLAGNIAQPGTMINIHSLHSSNISQYLNTAHMAQSKGFWGFIQNMIPTNIFQALAKGNLLAVIVFAIFFGLGVMAIGKRGHILTNILDSIAQTMFKITNWVMDLAPIGVFSLIGATVAQMGLKSLLPLGYFIALAYVTMILFVLIVMGLASRVFHLRITRLLRAIKGVVILAFTTASSEVALPKNMEGMAHMGVKKAIVSFVIPTGYTFNLVGSALYQSLGILFIAQAYHINLSIGHQIVIMLILMATSKGMAGVPSASFVVMLATASVIGIPMQGLAFLAGIDRIVDMGRTAVNVIGNSQATEIIGKSEHSFNLHQANRYLQKATSK